MNYEIKSINPLSVLMNSIRIFLIVGFVVGTISFFFLPNPNIRMNAVWQRLVATILFTVVYGLVVSVVLTFISWLYNVWSSRFKGITVHLEQQD